MQSLSFNPSPSHIMHIDLNSCFATVEQQANPLLRGKPIAVAAFASPNGCILAPSVEAKTFGVKTGMRVKEGKQLCPKLMILSPDPWKYRNIHLKLRRLISDYTSDFAPKSIDEFLLELKDYPAAKNGMLKVGSEIKKRIKHEVGDWLTVSIGVAPNRYLAKIAAGLKKPDGLEEINIKNYREVYSDLQLTDLTGIKTANASRLSGMGIHNVTDFFEAPLWKLKAAFESINGYYWFTRLRGWEVDDVLFGRKSYGNSTALGKPLSSVAELSPVMARLTEKMSGRLRSAGYKARGVHLAILYKDGDYWHEGGLTHRDLFDTRDFFKAVFRLLVKANPRKPVQNIAVSCFDLSLDKNSQLSLFEDVEKKEKLTVSIDTVNEKWGDYTVGLARSFDSGDMVKDRIAFGGVKELEEFTLQNY